MININYHENIQRVLDYIEENLKNDINNSKQASLAGYSEYHFLRIFREVVHLTPANYIRKRRISEIVRHMELDERPISDIAFEYGFNLKENFIRAFKAEHHILPMEFKLAKKLSGGAIVEDFGACIWNFSDNKLDYYIGIREEEAHGDLSNTILLSISGGLYATFLTPQTTHFDFVNMIH